MKNDGKDKPGFGDVVHALASGRTSVVIDPGFDRSFYRLAGYRPLGRRAVRVDILERLADLIRPALSWKAGLGARPDGAFDGQAFMVTPPMMSILGANADDMEDILEGPRLPGRAESGCRGQGAAGSHRRQAREAAKAAADRARSCGSGSGRLAASSRSECRRRAAGGRRPGRSTRARSRLSRSGW